MDFLNFFVFLGVFLISISFHEFFHAYVAYLFGDNTAKYEGRMTINPVKHIDIVGLLAILVFHFGWAKPVPVNPNNLRSRPLSLALVSFAGPFANFLLALLSAFVFNLFFEAGFYNSFLFNVLKSFIFVNSLLMIFNLIPIYPLDGAGVLDFFIPQKLRSYWEVYKENGPFILISIIAFSVVFDVGIFAYLLAVPVEKLRIFILILAGFNFH
ncbi:MAG: site-2 protease family protein [Candidatus Gracilibacteria bacterium]|jgi:Zn-dependent protease|nr:site-2 protease family protein [Candidatus Gracilibacteria bacterium]